jgi:hypothetical protein
MQSFREQGIDAEFEGIGGPQMIAEGFKSYYPMEILSVMGIVEVLKDLKKLFAVRDGLVELWTAQPVDVFIGIDAPDFNLRLSKTMKEKTYQLKRYSMSVHRYGHGDKDEYMASRKPLIWCYAYFRLKRIFINNTVCQQLLWDIHWQSNFL